VPEKWAKHPGRGKESRDPPAPEERKTCKGDEEKTPGKAKTCKAAKETGKASAQARKGRGPCAGKLPKVRKALFCHENPGKMLPWYFKILYGSL
jgi:hypothetical protein